MDSANQATCLLILCLTVLVCGPLAAQNVGYSFDTIETHAGDSGVPISFSVSTDSVLNSVQISVSYDHFKSTVTGLDVVGGALDGVTVELFDSWIDVNAGRVTAKWLLDSTAPFNPVISVGADQLVATLYLDVNQGLTPGTHVFVDFVDGLGTPPLDNLAHASGVPVTPTTTDGGITISNDNYLLYSESTASPGDLGHRVEIQGINTDNLQGFSVVGTFDKDYAQVQAITITDTITEVVGAEFVEEIINNDTGYYVLGVLLDLVPPFDDQTIPASGLEIPYALLVMEILDSAALVDEIPLTFENGLGTPPVENVFVIANQSVYPNLQDGAIQILSAPIFVRADANGDGRVDKSDAMVVAMYVVNYWPYSVCEAATDVDDSGQLDLADAIYLLSYLFLSGPPVPEPFPLPGVDPTPPYLPCDD